MHEAFCKDLRPSLDWSTEEGWRLASMVAFFHPLMSLVSILSAYLIFFLLIISILRAHRFCEFVVIDDMQEGQRSCTTYFSITVR